MKISKFFMTVFAIAGIYLWCGIYPAGAQDEAISADLFTEGNYSENPECCYIKY